MKTLAETIIRNFAECLQDGIHDAPKGAKYVAVHVSSGHMSIFCEYYTAVQDIEKDMAAILIDGQAYSQIKLVWDIEAEELLYYDAMGFTSGAHDYCMEHKDDPKPVYVPPPPIPPHPNVRYDHICQSDPGSNVCYYCGGPVTPVDITHKINMLNEAFKKLKPPEETEEFDEDFGLEKCPQCNEPAWDGYICHSCGMKNI